MDKFKNIVNEHPWLTFGTALMLAIQVYFWIGGVWSPEKPYDKAAHFLTPLFGAPILYLLLEYWGFLPSTPTKVATIFLVALVGVTSGLVWEIAEFLPDQLFNTKLQLSNQDTMLDMILVLIGSILGGFLITTDNKKV